MQTVATLTAQANIPSGTGGFLDPEKIAERFGIEEGMSVADFGSGSGYFTIALAEKVGSKGHIYALDIREEALDNVRAKARIQNIPNIETIRTNLEILGSSSLANDSQDIVLLANILFQSQKDKDIIREGVRVLKKNGRMIIIDWKKGTGGFGPPDSLRLSAGDMKKIAQEDGLNFAGDLDAGQFHFGLVFSKP